jgi:hypothetical protein
MGNEALPVVGAFGVVRAPAVFADVQPLVTCAVIEQQRVQSLLVPKTLPAGLTDLRPGLDVPFDHQDSLSQRAWHPKQLRVGIMGGFSLTAISFGAKCRLASGGNFGILSRR